MDDPFGEEDLNRIFNLDERGYLRRNESTSLEFKQAFNLGNLEDYARDFAAFANNKGGYLVFGIKDSPREVIGLEGNHFPEFDLERVTRDLNSIFSQTLNIEKYEHAVNGKKIGILYTHQSEDLPVMAKKNQGQIKEADIYFRYGARTEKIRYPELKQIMSAMIEKEKDAWMRVFKQTAKIGAKNTAVLDTVAGTIQGNNEKIVVIDDSLISQLKFIQEGKFAETTGDPTLKLVGNLVPATVIKKGIRTITSDPYTFTPTKVATEVARRISKTFRSSPEHVWAWKYYDIRPMVSSAEPEKTNKKYCDYKTALKVHLYTNEWVEFLVTELSDQTKYDEFIQAKGVRT
jgi:hypothetical protein